MTKATRDQVRKHYEDQNLEVRIDASGHVRFRKPGEKHWYEGRWVSEYRVFEGDVVLT